MRKIDNLIRVTAKEIQTDHYYTGIVRKGNEHSARLNVPRDLIGKKVIIVVLPESEQYLKYEQN